MVELFDKLAKHLAQKYGEVAVDESSELKPKVNIREGRSGCCGKS